jgi:hypothetical protein
MVEADDRSCVFCGILLSTRYDVVGILAAAFFGVCAVAGMITLLPGASSLRLDEKGFGLYSFLSNSKVPLERSR